MSPQPQEEISCILCQLASESIAIEENGYTGRRCSGCGLIYISPRPALSAILNLYDHNQAHISAEWHIAVEQLKRRHARHNLRLIRRHLARGALLEIGAGAGYFLDEARRAGFEPHAIELNPIQAHHIRTRFGIPCEQEPLAPGSFGGRPFDIIYHSDILSHLYNPVSEFETMAAKLAPDGLLVFETGNYADVERRHYGLIGSFQYPDHLFFFGRQSLMRLLAATGFAAIEWHSYSTVPQLLALRAVRRLTALVRGGPRPSPRRASAAGAPPPARSRLNRLLQPAYQDLLYLLRYGAGSVAPKRGRPQTLIAIARKHSPAGARAAAFRPPA